MKNTTCLEDAETIRKKALEECDLMEEICYTYLEKIKFIRASLKAVGDVRSK
jgi:hypothetical protein